MAVVNFSIYKVLGTLSENKDGWKKQVTCTSWGRYNPKFDIRSWDTDYNGMTKGITFTLEEMLALRDLLNEVDLEQALEEAKAERAADKAKEQEEVVVEGEKPKRRGRKKKEEA